MVILTFRTSLFQISLLILRVGEKTQFYDYIFKNVYEKISPHGLILLDV